jgi:Transglycosylase SLT domain
VALAVCIAAALFNCYAPVAHKSDRLPRKAPTPAVQQAAGPPGIGRQLLDPPAPPPPKFGLSPDEMVAIGFQQVAVYSLLPDIADPPEYSLPDLAGIPEYAPEMLSKSERRKREKAGRLAKRRSKAGATEVATTKVDEPERAYPLPEPPGRRSVFAGIFSNDPSDGPGFSPNAGGGYAAVRYEARAQNVSEKLALSIARIESNGACGAQSSAKAIGVMQIKHTTAQMMGYTGSAKGLKNCKTSAKYGVKYLAWCLELAGGDVKKAALCYNQGHGTLLNKKKYGKRVYRTEAKGYIAKLKAQGWQL